MAAAAELTAQIVRMRADVTKRRQVILLNQIGGTAELASQKYPTAAVVLVMISKGMLRRESRLPWEKTVLAPDERLHWQQVRRNAKSVLLSLESSEVEHDLSSVAWWSKHLRIASSWLQQKLVPTSLGSSGVYQGQASKRDMLCQVEHAYLMRTTQGLLSVTCIVGVSIARPVKSVPSVLSAALLITAMQNVKNSIGLSTVSFVQC